MKTAAAGALLCAVAVILPTGLSASAFAQTAAADSAMPEALADSVEIRIAELHRTLRIMPSQDALFRAYADVMRRNAQAINALFQQRAQAIDFTAPARLRWYAQLTAAHAEAINKLIAPFDALYLSLSPAQQQAADRHFEELQQRRMARRSR
ncbi:MAG TPA: Spy/CpxP family protein refolding chaperone [Stellaceae bacterium]|nr:Spy/CpxP family protein refolding chaperone [Stellaceae bacterium]